MTRFPLTCLLLAAVSAAPFVAGCDDQRKPEAEQATRPGPEVVQRDEDEIVDPGTIALPLPEDGVVWDAADDLDDPAIETEPIEPVNPDRVVPAIPRADARVSTIHGEARIPFPEVDEDFRGPIELTRLSDHDPFENDIDPEDIPDVVPWEEAGEYVGHVITVEGRIVDIGQTRDGNINFLNFHADWRGKFYMVVFNDLAETLDGSVEDVFLNKLVRVRGEVEDHRGRPQIRILSMDQVEFVEEEGE